jgi:hypothetical protein
MALLILGELSLTHCQYSGEGSVALNNSLLPDFIRRLLEDEKAEMELSTLSPEKKSSKLEYTVVAEEAKESSSPVPSVTLTTNSWLPATHVDHSSTVATKVLTSPAVVKKVPGKKDQKGTTTTLAPPPPCTTPAPLLSWNGIRVRNLRAFTILMGLTGGRPYFGGIFISSVKYP